MTQHARRPALGAGPAITALLAALGWPAALVALGPPAVLAVEVEVLLWLGLALLGPAAAAALLIRATLLRSSEAAQAASEALRLNEARFRDFAEAASDWLWETDAAGRFTYLSERHAVVLGVAPEERLGKTRWELGLPEADGDLAKWAMLRADLEARRPIRDFRYRLRNARGALLHIKINGKPVFDEAGTFLGYRGTGSDVTAEVEAAAQAQHLALHDALTGLPNRILFRERLEAATAVASRDQTLAAVLCIDLDHFKDVNDTRGHAVGDLVLKEAATRLREVIREGDIAARLGGDEFAVLQTPVGSLADVQALCQRLVDAFRSPFIVDGHPAHLGLSIGVALAPVDADNPDDLLRHADLALYRAKSEGRGEFRLFEPVMDAQLRARKQLEQDLREALKRDELCLEYQPQVALATGRIVGAEALVRWRHPRHGLLTPSSFIPIAEQTGLILPLGAWILRAACTEAARWPGDVRVSVNLSPIQVRQPRLVDEVREVLHATGLAADRLELEITESLLLKDTDQVLAVLEELKEIGVHIAMDDFGTGYSSLGYLQRFPFDKLKIDRCFVRDLFVSSGSAAIIRAVIGLGRGLGISVIAEGVETDAQLGFLQREGCAAVQGFHLARPMPPAELARRLDQQIRAVEPPPAGPALAGLAEAPASFEHHRGVIAQTAAAAALREELGLTDGSLWVDATAGRRRTLSGCSRSA
jgi:diguanylate cyclase (GGDEF)-like protein/PAS domain S-box-containing protein